MINIKRENLPYRQGVIGFIFNSEGKLLLIQNVHYQLNEWRQPGGGLEPNEEATAGVLREIEEELGIDKSEIELLGISHQINQFEWPDEVIETRIKQNRYFRGQQQKQICLRLIKEKTFKLQKEEIRETKWVAIEDLAKYLVFPEQLEKTMAIIDEFRGNGWIR